MYVTFVSKQRQRTYNKYSFHHPEFCYLMIWLSLVGILIMFIGLASNDDALAFFGWISMGIFYLLNYFNEKQERKNAKNRRTKHNLARDKNVLKVNVLKVNVLKVNDLNESVAKGNVVIENNA